MLFLIRVAIINATNRATGVLFATIVLLQASILYNGVYSETIDWIRLFAKLYNCMFSVYNDPMTVVLES